MSFPRYPEYKDSGVEWLGQVPAHWQVRQIRSVARLESGHTPSRNHPEYWENCVVPWFSLADIWQVREAGRSVIFETKEKISELGLANSAARRLPAGTVMLSRTASVGFAAIMGVEMATTQDFANWVCGPLLRPEFLLYAFRAMKGEFDRRMMGSTHNTIYMPDIQALRLAVPTPAEQQAIADFLDRETAKIDALVAEQERLIELLKEKRQAVISHAVTKGLDPSVPMKDSGVEWIGEIPAHWQIGPLKHYWTVTDCKHVTADFTTDGIPIASIREVQGRWVDLAAAKRTTEHFYRLLIEGGRDPRPGDLIFSRNATVGEVAQVAPDTPRFAMGQDVVLLRKRQDLASSDYLQHLLRSPLVTQQLSLLMIGSTFKRINVEEIRGLVVTIPPTDEQRSITAILERDTGQVDALVSAAQEAALILQERRAALISAAVTGQIDVRGAAA